jgi:hypothetical protein
MFGSYAYVQGIFIVVSKREAAPDLYLANYLLRDLEVIPEFGMRRKGLKMRENE